MVESSKKKERKGNKDNKRNSKIGKRLAEQALGVSLETWQYVARRETHQASGYSLGIVIRSLSCVRRFVERNGVTHTKREREREREREIGWRTERGRSAPGTMRRFVFKLR